MLEQERIELMAGWLHSTTTIGRFQESKLRWIGRI